jgi:hypothetical protein
MNVSINPSGKINGFGSVSRARPTSEKAFGPTRFPKLTRADPPRRKSHPKVPFCRPGRLFSTQVIKIELSILLGILKNPLMLILYRWDLPAVFAALDVRAGSHRGA